jgi:limonene-1,2-epoxide hydrolase
VRVSRSPQAVVREFLAAWQEPRADELRAFLSDDAVWVDGPQGVRRGADVIVDELTRQLAIGSDKTQGIDTLVADGSTVMVEWHGSLVLGEKAISTKVMAAFEIDAEGRIREMRETYDLKSVLDQIEAAGFALPR